MNITTPILSVSDRLTLRPKGSKALRRNFAIVCFIVTLGLLIASIVSSFIGSLGAVIDFLVSLAMIPGLIASVKRRERLSLVLAVWAMVTFILLISDIFTGGLTISDANVYINLMILAFLSSGSYTASKIYSHVINNEDEILRSFESKLMTIKEKSTGRYGLNLEALRISDQVGVFRFFSARNMNLMTCLAPFVFIMFGRTSNFSVLSCADALPYETNAFDPKYCLGNILAAGISLEAYIWQLSLSQFVQISLVRLSLLYILFNFLYDILLLHKYRAKLFGAGIKFTNIPTLADMVEDYIWNFQAIVLLSLLEFLVPANPNITGLTLVSSGIGALNVYEVQNIISINDTIPPGQSYYTVLQGTYYSSDGFFIFFQFLFVVALNCSYIISVYGYYHNSNNSALLTFFKEQEIITLASKWNIKIKYQIENKNNQILRIIKILHDRYPHEKIEVFVEALMVLLEEHDYLQKIQD
jgi:hypothetical protein